MIIAIDGPAGAGKGTAGKMLAEKYQFAFLETGLLYRALAYHALQQGISLNDEQRISKLAHQIHLEQLNTVNLKSEEVSQGASQVAALGKVRDVLVAVQRNFASKQSQQKGVVLDGRDIGTYILPDADLKFFITASLEIRAQRRYKELQSLQPSLKLENVHEEMRIRDERDMQRSERPLKAAEDAIVIDTTTLSIEQVFKLLCHFIDSKLP